MSLTYSNEQKCDLSHSLAYIMIQKTLFVLPVLLIIYI